MADIVKDEKGSASFHRGFGLVRSAVSSVLKLIAVGRAKDEIKDELGLGPDQFTAAIRYCERSGLVGQNEVTDFGQTVLTHDSTLAEFSTQWIMHYFLSSPQRNSPNYWAHLIGNTLNSLEDTTSTSLLGDIVVEFAKTSSNQEIKPRTGETAATGFVSTYSQKEGLGSLGFLEAKGSGQYLVRQPQPIPAAAFACILADYWSVLAPQSEPTVELSAITSGELSQILHQSEAQLNALLAELAAPSVGMVQRQRLYSPYTITRLKLDAATVWEQLYL